MHPRNPYLLAAPDFGQLAVAQPSLAPLSVIAAELWLLPGGIYSMRADLRPGPLRERSVFANRAGRPTIDFKRADAVR